MYYVLLCIIMYYYVVYKEYKLYYVFYRIDWSQGEAEGQEIVLEGGGWTIWMIALGRMER